MSIRLYNQDNLEVMATLQDESIDVICIDPPYLYLKGQKLERPFDEKLFFKECYRLLTKNGFIVMFGRGESFYRWNYLLSDLAIDESGRLCYSADVLPSQIKKRNIFTFKEEIVWNKNYGSSPLMAITRVHETISIFSVGNTSINKVKVPYEEMKGASLSDIHRDLKRIKTILSNPKAFENLEKYLFNGTLSFDGDYNKSTTITSGRKRVDRVVSTAQMIIDGMNEKSIITNIRDHYSAIHPTQKPVRLLERLLALVIPKDKPRNEIVVADFFAGSMSCMEAVHNMGMQGIACEIDKEYFEAGKQRIENLQPVQGEMFEESAVI